ANTIHFTIKNDPDEIRIDGQEDGIGFLINDARNKTGTGILNMQSRSKIIGAQFHLESTLGTGTNIQIRIPKNSAHEI
ncbi:hypothetical protein N9355_07400, partial [Crocinitomicaceae bacterium]|nr:hypothetical protein [Crocinitomicaceae bacterium]